LYHLTFEGNVFVQSLLFCAKATTLKSVITRRDDKYLIIFVLDYKNELFINAFIYPAVGIFSRSQQNNFAKIF